MNMIMENEGNLRNAHPINQLAVIAGAMIQRIEEKGEPEAEALFTDLMDGIDSLTEEDQFSLLDQIINIVNEIKKGDYFISQMN